MGRAVTPAGLMFSAGHFTPSGERIAHGLVVRYGALDCVNGNAHRIEDAYFPDNGPILAFVSHSVYVAVVSHEYPDEVLDTSQTYL